MLSSISTLQAFLAENQIRPTKRLGQNFIVDGNIINKLLDEAKVVKGDQIFEIGPGPGVITEACLARGAHVIAVEKDRKLAELLPRLGNVDVYADDILTFPLTGLPYCKLVSNLPYHLTSPILARLVLRDDLFSSLTVVVQEEMARRMTAKPGTRDYGAFTLFLEFYTERRYAFGISRRCFYPQPKVDSGVVTLIPKKPPLVEAKRFFELVHLAFQGRRKMVRTSLGKKFGSSEVAKCLEEIGENPDARPETLTFDAFLKLTENL